jgi:hypothetical protein
VVRQDGAPVRSRPGSSACCNGGKGRRYGHCDGVAAPHGARPDLRRAEEKARAPFAATRPGAGPRHIAFHPKMPFAYAINELGSSVTTYRFDAQRGSLQPQILPSTPPDFTGDNHGAEIAVAPSGRVVYTSNRGHDSIAIFAIRAAAERNSPSPPTPSTSRPASLKATTIKTRWVPREAAISARVAGQDQAGEPGDLKKGS